MFEFELEPPKRVTLEEVVAKRLTTGWDSNDIEFLIEYQDDLDAETLAFLGVQEIKPLTPAQVDALDKPAKKK
jgi:hypothetical protein